MHRLYQKPKLQLKAVSTRCPSDQLCLTHIPNEGCDCHVSDVVSATPQCRHLHLGTAERGFRLPVLYNLQVLSVPPPVRLQLEETGMCWISVSLSLLDFKLSQCPECCMFSFGWFPGVWILHAPTCLWRWNRQSVPKRRRIKFRRRGITEEKTYKFQSCLSAALFSHIFSGRIMRRSSNKLLQGIWEESIIAVWEGVLGFCAERLGETSNTLVKVDGVRAEIWTRGHLNTKQDGIHSTATFGGKVYSAKFTLIKWPGIAQSV